MKTNSKISSVQSEFKKKAISLTTYRALFIAKLLSIKALSYEEIAQAFANDSFLSNACHKDTIANTINSLRISGFEIEKPKPSNNFKFQLISHPFKFKINQEQAETLHLLRNSLYYLYNYKIIFDINDIYDKIKTLSNCEEHIDLIESSNYLRNIDKNILNKCLTLSKEKSNAIVIYDSPLYGNEIIKIKTEKVVFENNRLYLWSYSYKYEMPSYLRIDKILEIKKDKAINNSNVILTNFVEYELTGNAAKKFIPKNEEIILNQENNKIIVKANVINKFNFFQRIISFADECKILYPENIKNDYLEHLNNVIGIYKNDN